jgi:DNA-binding PadR family transcriptional regulator
LCFYQITEAGQAEFLRLLRQIWSEPERQYFAIDVGTAFMDVPRSASAVFNHSRLHCKAELEWTRDWATC